MQANKTADNQYLIPLMDGIIENIDIADGILLTTSEFVSQEDIEMTTTHDDLSLFQISFCIDGNMEWSYINNEVVHQFQIAAQQSQVRYGTFKECRSKISGNRKFKGISITLDEKIFEQIFTCIKIRGALYDTRKTAPVRVYTYTPNISKILSEILACHFCDEMKKIYLQGKIFELIAVYCDEVICKSPTNDFGIRISVEDYNALLKAREFIGENFAHPLTIPIVAKAIAINEQKLKDGFKRCFGVTVNVFDHVSFSYEQGTKILDDVSFTIPQGGMTAIVGPSGGGKTTITRLISRFWDIQGGSITIGGKDVREFTSDSLLKNMSMVFQNVYLFKDTIENNIKFGCPEASHEQVVEAAKKARCHDFISLLPEGYNTMIGEGGSTLSGGEKQRISIARAMLKNAPVVLLDEATASVDPENEVYLQQAISTLVKDKTLIVIAHRLSTIRDAEQILVIDNGKLVQHGKHDELVLQEGIYQKYWNIRQNAKAWKVAQ